MGPDVRILSSFRVGNAVIRHWQGDGRIHRIDLVNVLASCQQPRTAHHPRLVCQHPAVCQRDPTLSCAELLIMGQRNFRLGRPVAGRQSIEDMVRQAYNNARKIDGLLGREAFMRTCHAYATARPDVPDHMVPRQVAEILNPGLKADSDVMRPPATRIN